MPQTADRIVKLQAALKADGITALLAGLPADERRADTIRVRLQAVTTATPDGTLSQAVAPELTLALHEVVDGRLSVALPTNVPAGTTVVVGDNPKVAPA